MVSVVELPGGIVRRFTVEDAAAVLEAPIPVRVTVVMEEDYGTRFRLDYVDGYRVYVRADRGSEEERIMREASDAVGQG